MLDQQGIQEIAVPEVSRAAEGELVQARLTRRPPPRQRYLRQKALSGLLAVLVLVDRHVPSLGAYEFLLQWSEPWVAGAVAFDVFVRPAICYVWHKLPARVTVSFDKDKDGR